MQQYTLQFPGQLPTARNYPTLNVDRAKVETPWSRESCSISCIETHVQKLIQIWQQEGLSFLHLLYCSPEIPSALPPFSLGLWSFHCHPSFCLKNPTNHNDDAENGKRRYTSINQYSRTELFLLYFTVLNKNWVSFCFQLIFS